MSDAELIERLRVDEPMCEEHFTANAAADRIEALVKRLDAVKGKAEDHIIDLMAENAALVKERDRYLRHLTAGAESLRRFEARAERLAATNERLEAALRELVADAEVIMNVPAECYAVLRATLKGADHE